MTIYVRAADTPRQRLVRDQEIRGRISMYRLLASQRRYCGGDPAAAELALGEAESDLAAHLSSPPGTHFVSRRGHGADPLWVLDEHRREIYFGPRAGYPSDAAGSR